MQLYPKFWETNSQIPSWPGSDSNSNPTYLVNLEPFHFKYLPMDLIEEIVGYIETHDSAGINGCFSRGLSPNTLYNDRPLLEELTSEYGRGPGFKDCVSCFVHFGLVWPDDALLAVLLDDAKKLEVLLQAEPGKIETRYDLKCAYSQMIGVTLMHICAEFNHLSCAEVLLRYGLDVNEPAGVDELGFGGQTAIFHTVNQNSNASAEMMNWLLEHDADLLTGIRGLIWGKGYPWETFIPSVNPISYAMMGLLPQMHRNTRVIAQTVSLLLKKAYRLDYQLPNIPNVYLGK